MTVAKFLKIRGLVQGVYFRESLKQEALRLNVSGWVRNRKDGSVEAFVQGEKSDLELVIQWCRRGPERAKVESIDIVDTEADSLINDFQRRPTE
jgi:acylphosphatase